MHIRTWHSAITTTGRRYWRAAIEAPNSPDNDAFVQVEQAYEMPGYTFRVVSDPWHTDGGGSSYSGHCATLSDAIHRAAHYAWHITHPDERNPYTTSRRPVQQEPTGTRHNPHWANND
jgi:hypothetical protein